MGNGSTRIVLWVVTGQRVATVTLREGRSIELGSGVSCEVRLDAADAPERAARLTAVADRLRIERAPNARVLLNGVQVADVGTGRPGDLLEVGGATLAVAIGTPAPARTEKMDAPADLFEPSLRGALEAGKPVTVLLWLPGSSDAAVSRLNFERLLPARRSVFSLGAARAALIDGPLVSQAALIDGPIVPWAAQERGVFVEAAEPGARAEALLSRLFASAFAEDAGEPVFADAVMIALAEVLSRAASRNFVLEGEPGVGKSRLATWASRNGDRTLVAGRSDAPPELGSLCEQDNVVWIPPLRDRPADVTPLAEACVARARHGLGRPELSLSEAAREALVAYAWPGNLDELEASVLRACLVATSDVIELVDLPLHVRAGREEEVASLRETLAVRERTALLEALGRTGWNVTRTAQLLALPRRTVVWRMARLGLRRPRVG